MNNTTFETLAIAGFWTCAGLVFYAYAAYPALIWAAARVCGRSPVRSDVANEKLPSVSLVLAAYDEEAVIADRVRNALATDYPPDRFEVIVGSDGSRDHTAEIVRSFEGHGVRLLNFVENRGKASVLNAAASEAKGEILLMSDANTHINPSAAHRLASWFADPAIGAAVGRLVLVDPATGRNADGLYWKYEHFLKRCEARLGALLGANGAIYAVRRALYEPIPPGTIVDDFVIPLRARLRSGCRIVYDCDAVAVEETAPGVASEFQRRARIGAGGFQSLGILWKLLDPRQGWVAFAFLSHKVLRWLCPFFLIGALASNLWLANRPSYFGWLIAQGAFYATALTMTCVPARMRVLKPLRLTTMFLLMNAALLVGFWRWARGRQKGTWSRTARGIEPEVVVR